MGGSIQSLCAKLECCDRISTAAVVLKEIGEAIGLPYPATVADYSQSTTPRDENGERLATHFGWESEFRKDWVERRLVLVSPVGAICRLTLKPFIWKAEKVEEVCRAMSRPVDWHLTTKRGIYGALAVPVHMPLSRIGSVQWISRDERSDLKRALSEYGADLRAAAHLFMELVHAARSDINISTRSEHPDEKTFRELNCVRLTRRELECLHWVALGRTDVQIGETIHRVASTSRFHVENAIAKLGASNRTEAVAIALELGLIHGHDNIHPAEIAIRYAGRYQR